MQPIFHKILTRGIHKSSCFKRLRFMTDELWRSFSHRNVTPQESHVVVVVTRATSSRISRDYENFAILSKTRNRAQSATRQSPRLLAKIAVIGTWRHQGWVNCVDLECRWPASPSSAGIFPFSPSSPFRENEKIEVIAWNFLIRYRSSANRWKDMTFVIVKLTAR